MTLQGTADGGFTRALKTRNLFEPEPPARSGSATVVSIDRLALQGILFVLHTGIGSEHLRQESSASNVG